MDVSRTPWLPVEAPGACHAEDGNYYSGSISPDGGLGRIQKCEMRMSRLHHLNAALEASGKASWAQSDGTELLLARLHNNPFFHALKLQIARKREQWLQRHVLTKASADGLGAASSPGSDPTAGLDFWEDEARAENTPMSPRELLALDAALDQARSFGGEAAVIHEPIFDPSLTMKASECSTEASKELAALRALESRAQDTVQHMYLTLASVLPVCKAEVRK
jgi:hypothetical protein